MTIIITSPPINQPLLLFINLAIIDRIIKNNTMVKTNPIHELSMALVWLYYGFAMNGEYLKDDSNFYRKQNFLQ